MAGEDEKNTEWRTRAAGSGATGSGSAGSGAAGTSRPVDGLAVTGMILGIVAALLCWVPVIGAVLAILAIIFGGIGISKKISTGMAVTGLVLGIIAFLANVLLSVGALFVQQAPGG